MMNSTPITRSQVIRVSRSLPSFPSTIAEILTTLDDPDGSFNVLVYAINRDLLISARVLSVANAVALRGAREAEVCDIATATSLIGLNRVRHIALISSLSTLMASATHRSLPVTFWQHCVAVGICCEELAQHIEAPISPSLALISGLLHDIGQLWLHHAHAKEAQDCWQLAKTRNLGIEQVEREHFGVDHSTIGAWLAEHWSLPESVVAAIGGHHNPDAALGTTLVPLVHVGEVLSNALDLASRPENRVTALSSAACQKLGLVWSDDIRCLFGRIEARSRHANAFFTPPVAGGPHASEL
jgi:putative nucleotidyltransferase with HDIG domain